MKRALLCLAAVLLPAGIVLGAEGASESKPELPSEIVETLVAGPLATGENLYSLPPDAKAEAIAAMEAAVAAVSSGKYDLTPLVEHIRRHPNMKSCYAMMVLRNRANEAYARLSDGTKAAVLVDRPQWHMIWFTIVQSGPENEPDYDAETVPMKLGDAGRALLELDPRHVLPLLRDALLDCEACLVESDGAVTTKGNYAWWFARRLQGEKASLGRFKERRKLFQALPLLLSESEGKRVPRDIIDVMKAEASEGIPFELSSQMWRLYDGDYDYSALPDMIAETPNYRSYHLLLALRRRDLRRYWSIPPSVRARVLLSALGRAQNLGRRISFEVTVSDLEMAFWSGLVPVKGDTPPDAWIGGHASSIALAECGKPALKPLSELAEKLSIQAYEATGADRSNALMAVAVLAEVERAIKAKEFGCAGYPSPWALGWSLP